MYHDDHCTYIGLFWDRQASLPPLNVTAVLHPAYNWPEGGRGRALNQLRPHALAAIAAGASTSLPYPGRLTHTSPSRSRPRRTGALKFGPQLSLTETEGCPLTHSCTPQLRQVVRGKALLALICLGTAACGEKKRKLVTQRQAFDAGVDNAGGVAWGLFISRDEGLGYIY